MTLPPDLRVPSGFIYRIRRALYGLKQDPRAQFEQFSTVVEAASFTTSIHDPAVFVHSSSCSQTIFLLYVDDMILTCDDFTHINSMKQKLCETFLMTNLGLLHYFLGIEITCHPNGYRLLVALHSRSACLLWFD